MFIPSIQTYPKTKEEMTNQKTSQNTGELQEESDWCSQEWLMVEHMMMNPKIATCSEVLALAPGGGQRCCT
jgi:hypothetical protein